ncbi:MAG TPA: DUF2905 domain-containing protein [Thermoanaerobaculia bacterium]|nr:DUF2905 domain-containing protein [Thermoanaerobaculia bacterium]
MRELGRLLIVGGVILVVIGFAVSVLPRFGIGRLPGDFAYRKGNFTFYFPLMTSILLSLALTLLFWIFRR